MYMPMSRLTVDGTVNRSWNGSITVNGKVDEELTEPLPVNVFQNRFSFFLLYKTGFPKTDFFSKLGFPKPVFPKFVFPERVSEGFLLCTFSAGAELSVPTRVRPRRGWGAGAVPPYIKSAKTNSFSTFST